MSENTISFALTQLLVAVAKSADAPASSEAHVASAVLALRRACPEWRSDDGELNMALRHYELCYGDAFNAAHPPVTAPPAPAREADDDEADDGIKALLSHITPEDLAEAIAEVRKYPCIHRVPRDKQCPECEAAYNAQHRHCIAEADALRAQLADATRERDEARAQLVKARESVANSRREWYAARGKMVDAWNQRDEARELVRGGLDASAAADFSQWRAWCNYAKDAVARWDGEGNGRP